VAHPARLRLEVAQQEAQQRRLARSVRPDDADAVAAHDRRGEVPDDGPLAIREADVLGLEDQPARTLGLLDAHAQQAALAARLALLAQPFQRAHASFVARAPRLDALPDPGFLLRQLLVELDRLRGLGIQHRLFAREERRIVAGPIHQAAAVHLDDARGQPAQERAVMGHEDKRAAIAREEVLQPGDGLDIEMVGRLVEQHQVGIADQPARQQDPALVARREAAEVRRRVELHPAQDGLDLLAAAPGSLGLHILTGCRRARVHGRQSARNDLPHRAVQVLRHILGQVCDAQTLLPEHDAFVRQQQAREQLEQRGLAGPVAAQQPDALARLHLQVDAFQDQGSAEADRHVAQCNHCHRAYYTHAGQDAGIEHEQVKR